MVAGCRFLGCRKDVPGAKAACGEWRQGHPRAARSPVLVCLGPRPKRETLLSKGPHKEAGSFKISNGVGVRGGEIPGPHSEEGSCQSETS